MSRELLERFIASASRPPPGPVTHFEWHGGEPTLLGVEYFETIVALQRRHLPAARQVSNGLQTNGLLLDAGWAEFLARERFSVGLSLDGPPELHDRFRAAAGGAPTQARVVEAFRLLKSHRALCNVLCVLHSDNVQEPDVVYDFFSELG